MVFFLLSLCPERSFPSIFTLHLGSLDQRHVPPTFFSALSKSLHCFHHQKGFLGYSGACPIFMSENMPSGTQPDKTQYCYSMICICLDY